MDYAQRQVQLGSISTSEKEIFDLLKAWLAISFAFAIVIGGLPSFYSMFVVASLTVGTGFLLHELGHKIVAQRYGCFAEFRSFDQMLLLAVAMSFFGMVFAAPGAVMISGRVSKERSGRISIAGPLVNIALALAFLGLSLSNPYNALKTVYHYGFVINSWLALFNMIPFWLFDGYKVLKWSKAAYFAVVAAAVALMFLQKYVPAA